MAYDYPHDALALAINQIGQRMAEMERRVARMRPSDIRQRMETIGTLAAQHGLSTVEGLATYGARHAMMPGHRRATLTVLEHMNAALASRSDADRQTLLAAVALRIH